MIKIGIDPELFLYSDEYSMFVSAFGIFEGTKDMPTPTSFGGIQIDGTAVEFNTHPTDDEDEFVSQIKEAIEHIQSVAEASELSVSFCPVARFDEHYFNELSPEETKLGCSPDFNGLTGEMKQAPDLVFDPIRTSSGHVHIGWTDDEDAYEPLAFNTRLALIQALGPQLDLLSKDWCDFDSYERLKYYGGDWAWRPKPYGVEARQLCCRWLTNETHMRDVFRTSMEVARTFFERRGVSKAA